VDCISRKDDKERLNPVDWSLGIGDALDGEEKREKNGWLERWREEQLRCSHENDEVDDREREKTFLRTSNIIKSHTLYVKNSIRENNEWNRMREGRERDIQKRCFPSINTQQRKGEKRSRGLSR
jgi:hypothetical protein